MASMTILPKVVGTLCSLTVTPVGGRVDVVGEDMMECGWLVALSADIETPNRTSLTSPN